MITPYRSPDQQSRKLLGGPAEGKKTSSPWRALRPGETLPQWHKRMSHTCWRCGHYDEDLAALDQHESECR